MKQIPGFCRLFLLLPAMFLVQFAACDSSRIISGVYQTAEPVLIPAADGFDQPRWIEMLLAQFGPDLTGIVRVFDDGQFLIPSDGMCNCRYVDSGSVSDGEISFSFKSHGDCPGDEDTLVLMGAFVFEQPVVVDDSSGDMLVGTFTSLNGDGTPSSQVVFTRTREWSQVGEIDLGCDDPLIHGGDGG